jgi:hypothetical protein
VEELLYRVGRNKSPARHVPQAFELPLIAELPDALWREV